MGCRCSWLFTSGGRAVMKKLGVRGAAAMGIVCLVAGVMTVVTGAASDAKCGPDQIDVGGRCTSRAEVSKQILAITRSIMAKEDAKAVILRVDVGEDTVVNKGLGISEEGVPATP